MASLSQGRTAAAQCGLFTHKSVPVIFEPPCTMTFQHVEVFIHTVCSLCQLISMQNKATCNEGERTRTGTAPHFLNLRH